ncbi:hypothetical protein ACH4S9_09985 [Streptomyces sp. NPDC021225]|uniref:hypothetical protein n=1 Tax=Streptomyces sp. NPDC021225 TaxID=3365121 RepID=UPI0037A3D84D
MVHGGAEGITKIITRASRRPRSATGRRSVALAVAFVVRGQAGAPASGSRAEDLGEQGDPLGGGAHPKVQDGAVEVEAEVEERAASLFGGGQRRDVTGAVGGQGQPDAVFGLLP